DHDGGPPRSCFPPAARHAARRLHGHGHLWPDGRRRSVPAAGDRPLRNHLRSHDGDGRHLPAHRRYDRRALAPVAATFPPREGVDSTGWRSLESPKGEADGPDTPPRLAPPRTL